MTTATTRTTKPRNPRPRKPDVCRLVVIIPGERYTARPVPSEDGPAWRLRKADGTTHDVASHPYGAECDCPNFLFRRDGIDPRGCKHCRALLALGLIP